MRATVAGLGWVAAQCNDLSLFDLLAGLEVWLLQQVSVKRGVVQLGMVDDQVVRRRAIGRGVHQSHHAIGDGDDLCATGSGEVDAEVDALAVAVGGVAVEVRADGVAVGLAEQPGIGAGGSLNGRIKGLSAVWGSCVRLRPSSSIDAAWAAPEANGKAKSIRAKNATRVRARMVMVRLIGDMVSLLLVSVSMD